MNQHLRSLEERLERLLTSGWRAAGPEAQALTQEADAVAEAGLPELATRLRAVTAAQSPSEALAAAALAMSALRLLRLRLAASASPPGQWELLAPQAKAARKPDRLLPLCRLALGEGEVWACLKLRGSLPDELLLVEPPTLDQAPEASIWLKQPLLGHLRWRGRYPLGAGGELHRCALDEPRWDQFPAKEDDPFYTFREAVSAGKLKEDGHVLGSLRVQSVEPGEDSAYVWPDAAAREALRRGARARSWSLVWRDGTLVMPLALLEPGGLFRRGKLIHLVATNPEERLSP